MQQWLWWRHTHYSVSGGPMMVMAHSYTTPWSAPWSAGESRGQARGRRCCFLSPCFHKEDTPLQSSTRPAEKPSIGLRASSGGRGPAADRRVSAAVGRQAIATQGEEAGGGAAAAANKPRGGSASEQCRRVGKRRAFELATEQEAALVHHSHPRWAGLSLFRRRKWGRSAQQAAPGVMAHTAGAQDGHPVAGYFHYYRHSSLL